MDCALYKDDVVPISRFNKGEANKIFSEVKNRTKYVFKNNALECVLLSPERYQELMEKIEDMELELEALRRLADKDAKVYTAEEVEKYFE